MNSASTNSPLKVALTGDVALELLASYFRDAGYEVMPQGASMDRFRPEFVFDVTSCDDVLAREVPCFFDERMRNLAGCPYSRAGIRAIIEEFAWIVASRRQEGASPRKILAVDADNTLWKGILSEDGCAALRPYAAFQEGLRQLSEKGVVLVLLSKNDSLGEDVPVDHSIFAREGVNWAPKAGNLLEICRELNLSMDSVVFLDDNPHERAQMKAHLPEVAVAPWNGWIGEPEDEQEQAVLLRRLQTYFFSEAGQTAEDCLRACDYAASVQRMSFGANLTRVDYLTGLELWVRPGLACASDLDRLAQMAGKTNQFNATTIRRTREDFAALLQVSDRWSVFTFRAGDRFGEQGLVCYVVVDRARRSVTDFVMSCRAMGRTLEHFAYGYVTRSLGFRPTIDFCPSGKNAPFAAFLDEGLDEKTYYKEMD